MRSRYSAFVHGDQQYLLDTWHAESRPADVGIDSAARWLGLKVVATENGGEHDDEGMVEFVARFKVNGKAERLHERSRFVKVMGEWRYLRGTHQR